MSKVAYSNYLLEVKQEYTKYLSNLLVPIMYEGLLSIYQQSKRTNNENAMKMFQILLSRIPSWNQNTISEEYGRILNRTQCDWLDDLITAVFFSHARILSSIKTKNSSKKLNLKIPNPDFFIHRAYIECARQFWKTPYLFSDEVNSLEHQRNLREIEVIIEEGITQTVRKLLPVKNILQQYIAIDDDGSSSESESEDEEDITQSVSKREKKNLRRSVKKDISRVEKEADDDENYSIVSMTNEVPSKKQKGPSDAKLYESMNLSNSHEMSIEDTHPPIEESQNTKSKQEIKSESRIMSIDRPASVQQPESTQQYDKPESIHQYERPSSIQQPESIHQYERPSSIQQPESIHQYERPASIQQPESTQQYERPASIQRSENTQQYERPISDQKQESIQQYERSSSFQRPESIQQYEDFAPIETEQSNQHQSIINIDIEDIPKIPTEQTTDIEQQPEENVKKILISKQNIAKDKYSFF